MFAASMVPVSAGKMNGKPGGRNNANYEQPKAGGKHKNK